MAARFLRIAGYVWLALGSTVILGGLAGILIYEGVGALLAVLSPSNVLNYAVTMAILAPGILILIWADKVEAKKK